MKIRLVLVIVFIMHFYSTVEAKQILVTKSTDNIDSPEEGMLRYCILNAQNNDSILFLVDSVGLAGELRISYKSLTIDGGTGVIIDGNNIGRIFNISFDSYTSIIVKNLKIQNGFIDASDFAWGGGLYASGTGEGLVVDRCIFDRNIAHTDLGDGQGGAVRTSGGVFKNCYFFNNKVTGTGNSNNGGAIMATGEAKIINCVFAGNYAKYAGGISATNGTLIYNCTVTQNNSELSPGGVEVNSDAYTKVKNCIVFNNYEFNGTISNLGNGGSANYFNCALNEGDFMAGSNNNIALTENPFSLNQGIDSLSLKETAQCIDAGTIINLDFLDTDIIESSRISGSTIDIGAYEYYHKPNKWVITNSGDNTNPEEGMLRYALQNAVNGDSIVFNVDFVYADTTFDINNKGLYIIGNKFNKTNIVGDSTFRIFQLNLDHYDYSSFEFRNLKISKGYDYNGSSAIGFYGDISNKISVVDCDFTNNYSVHGQVLRVHSQKLKGCLFEWNGTMEGRSAAVFGWFDGEYIIDSCKFVNNINYNKSNNSLVSGALLAASSEGTVSNCSFIGNICYKASAGALYSEYSSIINCYFEANTVIDHYWFTSGGAVYSESSKFLNCMFVNNSNDFSIYSAGAIFSDINNTFINCVFIGNQSGNSSALFISRGNDSIINCTFRDNYSIRGLSGGINCDNYYSMDIEEPNEVYIRNSVLYDNYPKDLYQDHDGNRVANAYITNTAIKDTLYSGEGNIELTTSPFQTSFSKDMFFLHDSSKCINAGDTTGVSSLLMATDILGNNRINGNSIDIGAVEHYARLSPIVNWPTTNEIVYGNNLINAINQNGSANITGEFKFNIDTTFFPDAGLSYIQAVFSPHEDSILVYKSIVDNLEIQVKKVELSVSAVDTIVNFGDLEPEYRLLYSGFVLNEDEDVLDQKPTAHVNNYSELGVGEYHEVIEVSGGSDNNYDFMYHRGKLTIIPNLSALKDISCDLSVYPNPTSDVIIIEHDFGIIEYYITNLTGEQILHGKENTDKLRIDLSTIKTGLYILNLKVKGKQIEYKVIKY